MIYSKESGIGEPGGKNIWVPYITLTLPCTEAHPTNFEFSVLVLHVKENLTKFLLKER